MIATIPGAVCAISYCLAGRKELQAQPASTLKGIDLAMRWRKGMVFVGVGPAKK